MWYLIVPPVIVVSCLSFLLWFLSRRGVDPLIVEKMSRLNHNGQDEKASFLRTKEFLLRALEKVTQRFKIRSLQMHNALNAWSQSIKAHRLKVLEGVLSERSLKAGELLKGGLRERFKNRVVLKEKQDAASLKTKYSLSKEQGIAMAEGQSEVKQPIVAEAYERPMVSEKATEPEVKRERRVYDISREKILIGRIAANPKDFMAYEELGDQYLEMGNAEDAKACYRQVLKLSPAQRMVKIKIRRLERLFTEQRTE